MPHGTICRGTANGQKLPQEIVCEKAGKGLRLLQETVCEDCEGRILLKAAVCKKREGNAATRDRVRDDRSVESWQKAAACKEARMMWKLPQATTCGKTCVKRL